MLAGFQRRLGDRPVAGGRQDGQDAVGRNAGKRLIEAGEGGPPPQIDASRSARARAASSASTKATISAVATCGWTFFAQSLPQPPSPTWTILAGAAVPARSAAICASIDMLSRIDFDAVFPHKPGEFGAALKGSVAPRAVAAGARFSC